MTAVHSASAQSSNEICLADADLALDARLAADTGYSVIDTGKSARIGTVRAVTPRPTAGRSTTGRANRHADSPILAHSRSSLLQGIRRYSNDMIVWISFIAPDGSCGWLVDRNGVVAYMRSQAGTVEVAQLTASVLEPMNLTGRASVRSPTLRNIGDPTKDETRLEPAIEYEANLTAASILSRALLPEVLLEPLKRYRQLLIVPDNQLASFPFAMLPVGSDSNGTKFLIDDFAFQIAPSLIEIGIGRGLHRNIDDHLSTMPQDRRNSLFNQSLLIGDPNYADPIWSMPQLKGAAREAKAVATLIAADPYIGNQATLRAFQNHLNEQEPIYIHLATHGIADQQRIDNNRSFVALANGDRLDFPALEQARFRDGSVVVLSACQTGLGREIDVGIFGLPRMLQLRGAQSIVMSLWNVDDNGTEMIMTEFARSLKETGGAATSLARAIRLTKARFPDPAIWASFAVFSVAPF